MKHWEENNGVYDLIIDIYYEETVVLQFRRDKNDKECYNYISDILKVEDDCEYCDSIDEAKELFEDMIKNHFEDEINYYEGLLTNFE